MSQRNSRVKVGVVGCGVVATAYYLPYLMHMKEVELTAVCDIDPVRTAACVRLFGARAAYHDYYEMIAQADIDAVFILTGPGTHFRFTMAAAEAGKHILLQKPMALNMHDANAIVDAVRRAGVKALIEPSSSSPLDPDFVALRALIDAGVLGNICWFTLIPGAPTKYHIGLGGNPYGNGAFYAEESGGMLFDFPYAPTQIVTLLGACRSIMGMATISVPDHRIVPESEYNRFLAQATDPDDANYWDVVLDLPRTEAVTMQAPDNVFSLYEMASGAIGVFHVGRPFHPVLPGTGGGGLEIYGTEGNLIFGAGHLASIISNRRDLLPSVGADGWYHMPERGDTAKAAWPKPTPGGFNYYHQSTQHLIDCIRNDCDPLLNVEWGRHITEMMAGATESSCTGRRYTMTTTLTGLV
ncbi:MAG: Gfo/Idh/MocA family oxidoreductase [Anaerolineae bacterium]|nr:Gfo/Idh/MocA family oxidoreductase [Anaerolineae bacterium]